MTFEKILITGALGQIGSELDQYLSEIFGRDRIIISDIKEKSDPRFKKIDVTDFNSLNFLVEKYKVDTIYHLAAILSATGEKYPDLAYRVNVDGLHNVLEAARINKVSQVFIPSTIGVFGPETPRRNVPIETITRPTTLYGITKVFAEQLGNYYQRKFSLDVRGVRFPGLISYKSPPGGGTTDYAIEMIISAVRKQNYTCFLREDTVLPMMYMPDALEAILKLSEAPLEKLIHHTDFNLTSFSFSPKELAHEISSYYPEFSVIYKPDFRQEIADSWPESLDASAARREWGFAPKYNFKETVKDMIYHLQEIYGH
ncbi:MAG: NAD-dependent epimerase/dehydratase family protein [Thermoplasmatales archaeon]